MAFGLRHRRSLSATACAVLAILATSATGATSASALRRFARDVAGVKNVAKRLRDLLGETRAVPRKLAGEVSGALDELLQAIEERAAA